VITCRSDKPASLGSKNEAIIMDSIEGFVLAGGTSSRMGTDKAQLVLGGQTFIERIARALQSVASKVTVVGSNREGENDRVNLSGHTLPVVPDVFEKWGALGGLHAALSAARTDWALVVACDLPFVTGGLFLRLADLRAEWDAVAPVQDDHRPQPLCALYRTTTCRPIIEKLIKAGERRPVTLLQSVRTRWVAFEELAGLDSASQFFENVNTPEDYARAQRKGTSIMVL
jgi:molybdopterin-guanine dinucleotide biosynthesis protein A